MLAADKISVYHAERVRLLSKRGGALVERLRQEFRQRVQNMHMLVGKSMLQITLARVSSAKGPNTKNGARESEVPSFVFRFPLAGAKN